MYGKISHGFFAFNTCTAYIYYKYVLGRCIATSYVRDKSKGVLGPGDLLQFASYSKVNASVNYFTGAVQLWIKLN